LNLQFFQSNGLQHIIAFNKHEAREIQKLEIATEAAADGENSPEDNDRGTRLFRGRQRLDINEQPLRHFLIPPARKSGVSFRGHTWKRGARQLR
jgi:hypothetical protein